MGAHQNQSEFSIPSPIIKPAYSVRDIVNMGIASRTQLYIERKEGRLVLHKLGRRTLILHDDLMSWLRGLHTKDSVSEPHRKRAMQRWDKTNTATSAALSDQTTSARARSVRAVDAAGPVRG